MISAVKRLMLASKFYYADKHYASRNWGRSAQGYAQIAAELADDAKSLAAAKVFSRLAICNFNRNDHAGAGASFEKLVRTLARIQNVSEEELSWLHLHTEYLGQLIGCSSTLVRKASTIDILAVRSRLRWDFPVTDLAALIEVNAN